MSDRYYYWESNCFLIVGENKDEKFFAAMDNGNIYWTNDIAEAMIYESVTSEYLKSIANKLNVPVEKIKLINVKRVEQLVFQNESDYNLVVSIDR